MRMEWEDYKWYHAGLSAIEVSWFLMLLMLPFKQDIPIILGTGVMTILVPFVADHKHNMFCGHVMLYVILPFGIASSMVLSFLFQK